MKSLFKKICNNAFKRENTVMLALGFLTVVFIIVGICKACMPYEYFEGKIKRSEFGEADKQITVIAETQVDGISSSKKADINISSRSLNTEEIEKSFEECKNSLTEIILGDNSGIDNIVSDMELITFHEATGVEIRWKSSNPDLINEEGIVYPGDAEDNGYVLLTAELTLENESDEWKCNVKHCMKFNGDNLSKALDKKIEDINKGINLSSEDEYVILPKELKEGVNIKWKLAVENNFFLYAVISTILLIFLIYTRKSKKKKEKIVRKQEIEKEFPYFLDKLMMLLSAGIILSEAVERISEDYLRYTAKKNRSIFYDELAISVNSMKQSNSSFAEELMELSERLDIREFARLSVILRDSLGSGMDMVSKLEEESVMIWGQRKSAVQKMGRTADTKLIFPLMIILVVLIVIVMTPAIMQM